jgi:hypothetical protein
VRVARRDERGVDRGEGAQGQPQWGEQGGALGQQRHRPGEEAEAADLVQRARDVGRAARVVLLVHVDEPRVQGEDRQLDGEGEGEASEDPRLGEGVELRRGGEQLVEAVALRAR